MAAIRNDDVTADQLREYLAYEADTGRLIWHKPPPRSRIEAGTEAGSVHRDGYHYLTFRGRIYATHRVVWLLWHGEWPPVLLDHRDRVRHHNRIGNLRLGSPTLNSANRSSRKGSSSQYLGVCWNTKSQQWQAGVKRAGRQIHLGLFPTEWAAAEAAAAARGMVA